MTVYLANGTAVRSSPCREETLNYVHLHDDQLSLVAREMAPSASNRDMYSKGRSSKNGPAASGVPGKGKGLIPRVPSFANSIQLLKKKY